MIAGIILIIAGFALCIFGFIALVSYAPPRHAPLPPLHVEQLPPKPTSLFEEAALPPPAQDKPVPKLVLASPILSPMAPKDEDRLEELRQATARAAFTRGILLQAYRESIETGAGSEYREEWKRRYMRLYRECERDGLKALDMPVYEGYGEAK